MLISHEKRYVGRAAVLPPPILLVQPNGVALLVNPRRRSRLRDRTGRPILFCRRCGGRGRVTVWLDEFECEDCDGSGRAR